MGTEPDESPSVTPADPYPTAFQIAGMQEPNPNSSKGKYPRRPHNKSRNGCRQCKQRKVKCGEETPVCKKCQSYGTTCSFLQTHPAKWGPVTVESMLTPEEVPPAALPWVSSNSSKATVQFMLAPKSPTTSASSPSVAERLPVLPLSNEFSILDMELLHFWTTESAATYVESKFYIPIVSTTVVHLAFQHKFVMYELLALAALHLSHYRPERREFYREVSDSRAATGLALFRPQLANLTAENCHACFIFSTTTFTHSWGAQDLSKPSRLFFQPASTTEEDEQMLSADSDYLNINWVKLHRGTRLILSTHYLEIVNGPLSPLVECWVRLNPNREDLPANAAEAARMEDLPKMWREDSPSCTLSPFQKKIMDDAVFQLRRTCSMVFHFKEWDKLALLFTWFSAISDEYLEMLEKKIPEALVLAIYYCTALKNVDYIWWMKGKAKNLMDTLLDALGPGYERWTRWSIETIRSEIRPQNIPNWNL